MNDLLEERAPLSASKFADDDAHAVARKSVVGETLPPALRGDKNELSCGARESIHCLEHRDPWRFCFTLVSTWAAIIAAIATAVYAQHPVVSFLAVLFVATRQNVLGLLMHEQCHRLGFYSKKGDLLCNIAVCYPLLVTLDGYRRVHLAHHQNYFTDRDPDYVRKQGPAWTFPQRLWALLKLFLFDLSGVRIWEAIRGKGGAPSSAATAWWQRLFRVSYYLVAAGIITWLGWWTIVGLYWIVPLVTVLQVIVRWGAICEHKYDLIDPDVVESTPLIEPRWWEDLLLPNLNFTLHIYHHWFPRVPFSRLPEVHRIFRAEGLIEESNVFRGYGAYLRHLLVIN
jgi:fatty acid desaturase